MQKQSKISKTILLLILLVSCLSCATELEHTTEQCYEKWTYTDETKQFISVADSICECREYKLSLDFIGQVGNTYIKPFNYCKLNIGTPIDKYSPLIQFYRDVQTEIRKKIKKKAIEYSE